MQKQCSKAYAIGQTSSESYFDEFRLYGDGVDAFVVKEQLGLFGDACVVMYASATQVRRSDDSIARQLPHVKLVNVAYTVHLSTAAQLVYTRD